MDVTLERPAIVVAVEPSEISVLPIVTLELVSDEFAMLDKVFVDPEIDLFVKV